MEQENLNYKGGVVPKEQIWFKDDTEIRNIKPYCQ